MTTRDASTAFQKHLAWVTWCDVVTPAANMVGDPWEVLAMGG